MAERGAKVAPREAPKATPKSVAKAPVVPEEPKIGPDAWAIPFPEGAEFGGTPPGQYLSKCIEEPEETMSSKGEAQTQFTFEICDPEYPELEGRKGNLWVSRKPKSWWLLVSVLEAMEVPYQIDKANRVFRFDPMACVGAMCKTVWEESNFGGRTRVKISRVIGVNEEVESLQGKEDDDL